MIGAAETWRAGLRPFVWVAWLGVATTASNTLIPLVTGSAIDASTAQALREPILFAHALATLLPMLALALSGFRASPFAAVVAISAVSIEKALELIGQTLSSFPPEETLAGVPVRDVVAAAWDQLYFTLWFCNTLGSAAAGWLMARTLGGRLRWIAAGSAWLAGVLTLLLMLGTDYLQWPVPSVPGWLFFVAFTAYRISVALTLMHAAGRALARPQELG